DWAIVENHVMAALRQSFKPEFLNRVDDIIVFHPLGREHITAIVDLQLGHLRKLRSDRKLTLELTTEALAFLGEEGYDPAYGARPLKRATQRFLQNPLALAILEGRFGEGDHIVADAEGDALVFRKGEPALVEAGANA